MNGEIKGSLKKKLEGKVFMSDTERLSLRYGLSHGGTKKNKKKKRKK